MPGYYDGLRYRGSDRKIKDQFAKQTSDKKEKYILTSFSAKKDMYLKSNPIVSITDRSEYHNPPKSVKVSYAHGESPSTPLSISAESFSGVIADDPASYNITDGVPPNGIDFCASIPDALKCEQWYVSSNSSVLATSHSLLYGEYPESGDSAAASGVWDCTKAASIKDLLKQIIADPNINPKFGTTEVDIQAWGPQTQMEFSVQGLSDAAANQFYASKENCDYNPPNSNDMDPIVEGSLIGWGAVGGVVILWVFAQMYKNCKRRIAFERERFDLTDMDVPEGRGAVAPVLLNNPIDNDTKVETNLVLNDSVGNIASIVDTATPNQPSTQAVTQAMTQAVELQNRKQSRSVY